MKSLYEMIPDPEELLALEPEELAGVMLEYLNSLGPDDRGQLNRHNFSLPHTYQQYPPNFHKAIGRALMEAWVWLEREGLLAPDPGQRGEWVFVTRRGARVRDRKGLMSYRRASLLPHELLHPRLATKVTAPFPRGGSAEVAHVKIRTGRR